MLALAMTGAALAAQSEPMRLLSVDTDADELVEINAETGEVRTIGPLGQDVHLNLSMTNYRGSVFAVVREEVWQNPELVMIDASTGAILHAAPTILRGQSAFGESLFVWQDKLHMSADPGRDTTSELLCRVSLGGALTEIADFSSALDDDLDGVDVDPASGRIFNFDSDGSPTLDDDLFGVTINPPTQTLIQSYTSRVRAGSVAVLGYKMYALRSHDRILRTIDVETGDTLSEVALSSTAFLYGLAFAPGLLLGVSDDEVTVGEELGFATIGGAPDLPTILFRTEWNGIPVLDRIARASFDAEGRFVFSKSVPPGLSGSTMTFRALGYSGAGPLVLSNTEAVRFQ